jgi:hypothetical protein
MLPTTFKHIVGYIQDGSRSSGALGSSERTADAYRFAMMTEKLCNKRNSFEPKPDLHLQLIKMVF